MVFLKYSRNNENFDGKKNTHEEMQNKKSSILLMWRRMWYAVAKGKNMKMNWGKKKQTHGKWKQKTWKQKDVLRFEMKLCERCTTSKIRLGDFSSYFFFHFHLEWCFTRIPTLRIPFCCFDNTLWSQFIHLR